jgi:uncharacterized protein (DUF302 family)
MSVSAGEGITTRACRQSLEETLGRLEAMLRANGVTIFAMVDHSGEAAKVGMTMRPTKFLIFGHPKAGTPLMIASPSVAIDLPLKILLWEDGDGRRGSATTLPATCRSGTSSRRSCSRTSRSSRGWPSERASDRAATVAPRRLDVDGRREHPLTRFAPIRPRA